MFGIRKSMVKTAAISLASLFAGACATGFFYERSMLNEKEKRLEAQERILDARGNEMDAVWKLKSLISEYNALATWLAGYKNEVRTYIIDTQDFIDGYADDLPPEAASQAEKLSKQAEKLDTSSISHTQDAALPLAPPSSP